MIEDFIVSPMSAKNIELKALAWRDALGVSEQWAPNVIELIENQLPKLFPHFALLVHGDSEMGDAEAYTQFNPPVITVRKSVYSLAEKNDGRARMTFAHEFGHLVLHPGASKPRVASGNYTSVNIRPFESAEWQARKFAAYFLLPEHVVRQFATARELSNCCHVSLQAAEIRFTEVDHIKNNIPDCVSEIIEKTRSAIAKKPTLILVKDGPKRP
jgi:Zn-dependent peptidase ImmA (M78 family)